MASNCFPDPKLYPLQISAILNKNKNVHIPYFSWPPCSKNDCSNPLEDQFTWNFATMCAKVIKEKSERLATLGERILEFWPPVRWRGTNPPSPVGNRMSDTILRTFCSDSLHALRFQTLVMYTLFIRRMQSLGFHSCLLRPVSDHFLINRVSKEGALHQVIKYSPGVIWWIEAQLIQTSNCCQEFNPSVAKGFGTTSDTKGGSGRPPCYLITPLT